MSQNQTPRQKMDQNIESNADFIDEVEISRRRDAAWAIGREVKNGCVITQDRQGNRIYLDACLACFPNSDFQLTTYHSIHGLHNRQKKKDVSQREFKWKLKDLSGLSLEEDATDLIRRVYDEAGQKGDNATQELLVKSALGFSFIGCYNHITPNVVVGEGTGRCSELSFVLYDENQMEWWIDGLAHIAHENSLDMNMAEVEGQMDAVSLQEQPQQQPQSTKNKGGRRMSKQEWTQEGLAHEQQEQHQTNPANRRTRRFTILPNENDMPSSTTATSAAKKGRQSVFGAGTASSLQSEQQTKEMQAQFRTKELEYQTKIDKMDRDHSKELQDLRLRLDRAKNETNQLQSEMQTMQENHDIALTTQDEDFQLRQQELENEYNTSIESVKAKYSEAMEQLNQLQLDHDHAECGIAQLRLDTESELNEAQLKHSAALNELLTTVNEWKEQTKAELENMKKMITHLLGDKKKLINALIESQGNIRVFVRVRPVLPHEIEQSKAAGIKDLVCVGVMNQMDMFNAGEMGSTNKLAAVTSAKDDVQTLLNNSLGAYKVTVNGQGKNGPSEYQFENVFGQESTQHDVAQQVLPFVTSVADGYSTVIFSYGQTGSGKTYTMEGTDTEMGINYTALTQLFTLLSDRQAQMAETGVKHEFSVNLSAVEVYNEQVKDLFSREFVTMNYSDGKASIQNLTSTSVHSCAEIRSKLRNDAYKNRTIARTDMNDASSRSHALLFINITSVYTIVDNPSQTETVTSRLVLVDLAGSERVARSGVQGTGLIEANNINNSLTVLSRVLASLQQGEKHIPYRESKLTMLLSDSLSGDSKVLMFANVSPAGVNATETNSTLQFASRAQRTAIGKALKNSSTLGTTAAARPTMIGMANGAAGAAAKKEDSIAQLTKIKTLESDKQALQLQIQQLQTQLQNAQKVHQQQIEVMTQEKQSVEFRLEKSKESTRQALADKAAAEKQHHTNALRLSTHMPSSTAMSKPTPSKSRPSQSMLSISTMPLGTVPMDICEEDGQDDALPLLTPQNSDMVVQLAPPPTIIMPTQLSTTFANSQEQPTQKKRKSIEMLIDTNDTQVATHINKQPRTATMSSTTPAKPTTMIPRSATGPSSTLPTSRPTLSSTAPVKTMSAAVGTNRPTMGSSSAARTTTTTTTATSRPTLSAVSSSSVNRPTMSSAGRTGVPTTGAAPLVKKPAVAPAPSSATRAAASAAGVSTAIGIPRKTVSAIGTTTSAVRKPIGR